MGLNSQEDEALRNTPPQRSSAFAWPVVGNSDNPNNKAAAGIAFVIRRFMVSLPRVVKGAAWQFADRAQPLQQAYQRASARRDSPRGAGAAVSVAECRPRAPSASGRLGRRPRVRPRSWPTVTSKASHCPRSSWGGPAGVRARCASRIAGNCWGNAGELAAARDGARMKMKLDSE